MYFMLNVFISLASGSALNNPVFQEYAEALTARIGEDRTNDVLSVSRFNSIVYPNCSFMSQFSAYSIRCRLTARSSTPILFG